MKVAKISATVAAMLAQIWRNVAVCATCKSCEPCRDGTEGDLKVAKIQLLQQC
jgi:NADH:ubiquinone oxidoreductase subunit F (NADH-binding)